MPLLPNINVGTTANDGTGDDLRTAFTTVNENFQYIEAFFPNTSNIGLTANIDSTGVSTFNNVTINNVTSTVTFTSTINATGIAATGNISANNISVTNGVTANTVSASTLGNSGAILTGTLSTAAQTNVTSLGTLTGLTLSGTLIGTTINAATLGNADSAIIAGSVSASTIGNSDSTTLTGTLSTAAQPNITSVGTLGNVVLGNLISSANYMTIGNVLSVTYAPFNDLSTNRSGSANLQFYTNSGIISAWNITGNITLNTPTFIANGVTKKIFINNESGSTQYVVLFNSKNNLGTNTVTISNGTVATIDFVAIDNTVANIFQTISNT